MSADRQKAEILKGAAVYLYQLGGEAAQERGIPDAEELNRVWYALDVEGFRQYLWERSKEVLEDLERGAA
jgi:hypothetical protein